MSDQYIRAGVAPADRFTTIYSGMNVEQYLRPTVAPENIRSQLGISDGDIVVGKIARLFHLKGHEYLIESAKSVVQAVPNLKFLFIGDGILREEFQQRIGELGLSDHFIFAGLIKPELVGNYITPWTSLPTPVFGKDWHGYFLRHRWLLNQRSASQSMVLQRSAFTKKQVCWFRQGQSRNFPTQLFVWLATPRYVNGWVKPGENSAATNSVTAG